MEIPAWFETLFEKVVVVFEMPASEGLQAAGSTVMLPWLETLLAEAPVLVENVRAGLFPTRFLTNILGFSQGLAAKLPGLLTLFMVFYLLCGGATVALRLKRKQTSLLTFSRQAFNAFLTWAAFLVIPMRKALMAGGFGEELYAKAALLLAILAVVIPLCSVIRYLWVYRLTGIPHAIFDVGFGLFAAAVLLLSAKIGILKILILLAMAALTVVQWEEPEYEEVPVPAKPAPQKAPAAPQPAPAPQKAAPAPQRTAPSPQKTAAPQRAVSTPQRAAAAPQKTAPAQKKTSSVSREDLEAKLKALAATAKKWAIVLKGAILALVQKAIIAFERLSTDIRVAMARRSAASAKTSAPAKRSPQEQSAPPAKPADPPKSAAPAAPAKDYPTMALDIDQIIAEVEAATDDVIG